MSETMRNRYEPTFEHVIKAEINPKEIGVIVERKLMVGETKILICEVGAQKSEEERWIRYFMDVEVVLFVVALDCYDEINSDTGQNEISQAIELFGKTINNKSFEDKIIMLFLNKKDLFEIKINNVPITTPFLEYEGDPHDFNYTSEYIISKFYSMDQYGGKRMKYNHLTCATDESSVQIVFHDLRDAIISNGLARGDLF